MAGTRAKRKAEASRTGDLPEQPKPRRAAAAPQRGLEVLPWSSPCVITKETMAFDLSHTLRSGRNLWFPNTAKPGPLQFRKGEEALYDISWCTPACARIALKHYNRLNEDEHELVKAVDSISFFYNGQWMHANFLAKSKGGTSCADLVPKSFFADLKMVQAGIRKWHVSPASRWTKVILIQDLFVDVEFGRAESSILLGTGPSPPLSAGRLCKSAARNAGGSDRCSSTVPGWDFPPPTRSAQCPGLAAPARCPRPPRHR